jgi:hypothetical protein
MKLSKIIEVLQSMLDEYGDQAVAVSELGYDIMGSVCDISHVDEDESDTGEEEIVIYWS